MTGVAFVDWLPRDWHPDAYFEVEGLPGGRTPDVEASYAAIEPDYFDVLDAPVRGGAFHSRRHAARQPRGDRRAGFVREVLGGRNAVGRSACASATTRRRRARRHRGARSSAS